VRRISYQILLFFLRGLVHAKRGVVAIFRLVIGFFLGAASLYRRTIGFRIYRVFFGMRKSFDGWMSPWSGWLADHLSRRGPLQAAALLAALFLLVPESKLFTRDDTHIPGRETLLYHIVGPGDQDFALELEEVIADETTLPRDARTWREGSATAESGTQIQESAFSDEGIAGVALGGTALSKPTILPGATMPGASVSTRTEVVYYEVEAGDVIGAIAERYGVSVVSILWANNLSARSYIRPVDKLKIPPVSGVLHVVKKGDTVGKIARAYQAKEADIIAFNKLQPGGTDLVVGEEIVVPGGAKPAPIAPPPVFRSNAIANIAAPPSSIQAPAGSGYLWPTSGRGITQYCAWRHTGLDIGGPVCRQPKYCVIRRTEVGQRYPEPAGA
jgi:LysM repeat protein